MPYLLRSSIYLLIFLIASCVYNKGRYGRVDTYYSTGEKDSFAFLVTEEFVKNNADSLPDEDNLRISEAESDLLKHLLKEKEFCLDEYNDPLFTITSRQEKIFDATFAHLIEENYKARPLAPRTYFGKCKNLSDVPDHIL